MERKKEEILNYIDFDRPNDEKRDYYANVSRLLSEFEKEIREDQIKKYKKIVKTAFWESWNPEEEICSIMEAD